MSIEINKEALSSLSIADLYALKETMWYKAQVSQANNQLPLYTNYMRCWEATMKQIDIKIADIFIY